MVEPLRHRQTKEAATDMFYLTPPRHISTLPKAALTALKCDFRSSTADIVCRTGHVRKVPHVWTAPDWQGLTSRRRLGRCCKCVRPLSAVHMTAGHNALRGSGPGQKHAFDNAVAQVGCPDRRIDRLCITCCSPSQPSHHIGCPMRFRLRRERGRFFVAFTLGHDCPRHSGDLVGERDGRDLRGSPR